MILATWHAHEVIVIETWNNPVVDVEFATIQVQDGTKPFKCYSSHSYENPGLEPAWTDIGIVEKDQLEDIKIVQESELNLEAALIAAIS